MSQRRNIDEIVLVKRDDGEFYARIDALGADSEDECPQCYLDKSHDQDCREWPNVEILNSDNSLSGQYMYHVSECDMSNQT
jgi:hypothetical protein